MSLRSKVILILVAVTLVADTLVVGVWQPWFLEKAIAREEKGLRGHLVTLSDAILPFLLQNQVGAVYETLDAALNRSTAWTFLALYDKNGRALYPLEIEPRIDHTANIGIFKHTIIIRNAALGHLELHVDLSELRKAVTAETRLIVGLFTTASVLSAALIAALLEIVVGRRTTQLVKAAEDIAHGQYAPLLETTKQDEIGRLSVALDQMRRAIDAEKESLRDARDAAEASNKAKSIFLATMSHEIRTPLNGILGMAQLLLDSNTPESERRDYARTILNSGQTLMTLLNDILDLSRVEAGKVELADEIFYPKELIEETAALFAEMARGQKLELQAEWSGPSRICYRGDPVRLRQMLSNLVSNAIKFTQQGRVTIIGRTVERYEHEALLEFKVCDTGIGIPKDKLSLLFTPFSQIDDSASRAFVGTGLGLSLVHRLALLMHGEAGVDSAVGKGSTFWFRARVSAVAEEEERRHARRVATVPTADTAPSLVGRHVLVVEDNPTNAKVVEAMLNKLSFKVLLVENGQAALDILSREHDFELVLMDCQMPVMDGLATTAALRKFEKEQQRRHLPVIALTASAFSEDRDRCIAAGMDDFLAKPINIDKLSDVLQRWLRPNGPSHEELDEATLNELCFSVGEEIFNGLVSSFLQDAAESLTELRNEVTANNISRVREIAHRLYGLFGLFGAHSAADAARAVEFADEDELARRSDDLLARGRAVIVAMREVRRAAP